MLGTNIFSFSYNVFFKVFFSGPGKPVFVWERVKALNKLIIHVHSGNNSMFTILWWLLSTSRQCRSKIKLHNLCRLIMIYTGSYGNNFCERCFNSKFLFRLKRKIPLGKCLADTMVEVRDEQDACLTEGTGELYVGKYLIRLFNPLADDNILALSKLKAFADDNFNIVQMMEFVV